MSRELAAEAEPVVIGAFEEFVRSIADELLSYFARRVVPGEDAADCLSETLLILWRRRDRLPHEHDQRRAWSYGVARNVLASQRRRGVRLSALTGRLREELRHHPVVVDTGDDDAISALAVLAERDRELVCLIAWEGLGVAEAGAILGLRPDAARARFSRARRKLRVHLEGIVNSPTTPRMADQ